MARAKPVKWTREQRLVALNLYRKLPFGRLHERNPVLIEVAQKMGRTAGSLTIKLCNFAALDPAQQKRGVVGMRGFAKEDESLWAEFHENVDQLGPESEQLLHDLFTNDEAREVDLLGERVRVEPSADQGKPTEGAATVKVRRGQQLFRQSILGAYGIRCCISGINVPEFLVASHIKPWCDFPAERLNPRNGLCLSKLHDAAFDSGLITLDDQFRVILSNKLRRYFPQPALEQSFIQFDGKPISLPEKFVSPDSAFLAFHREHLFVG